MTSRLLPSSISSDSAFTIPNSAETNTQASDDSDERRFGRFPGMYPPINMFPDRLDRSLEVQLGTIDYYPSSTQRSAPIARDGVHWMIRWQLQDYAGYAHFRMVHVLTERVSVPGPRPVYKEIYTNWGPMTKSQDAGTIARSLFVPLGTLGLSQRKTLERIAETEPVREPDGLWNCQDWLKSVLWRAVSEGLFEKEKVEEALATVSSDAHLKAWLLEHKD